MAKKNILYLDTAYTLKIVKDRELDQYLISKKCGNYFNKVWVVHPFVDIPNKTNPKLKGFHVEENNIYDDIIFIEGESVYFNYLKKFYLLNFLISQFLFFIYLIKLIKTNSIDLIQCEEPYFTGLIGLFLKIFTGRPIIVSIVANYDEIYNATGICAFPRLLKFRFIEKLIERPVLFFSNLIFCVNDNNKSYAINNGANLNKCVTITFGRFMDRGHQIEPSLRKLDQLILENPNKKILIYVGRLIELKFPDDVIRAFAIVVKKFPNSLLLIAGDGSMRNQLEKLTADLEISSRVNFLGNINQSKLASILPGCSVYLSPLTGGALIEASLAELPIVAYDRDWQKEFVGNNEAGYIVPFRDWTAMGNAAISLLDNEFLSDKMGKFARKNGLELTNLSKIYSIQTQRIDELFKKNKLPHIKFPS